MSAVVCDPYAAILASQVFVEYVGAPIRRSRLRRHLGRSRDSDEDIDDDHDVSYTADETDLNCLTKREKKRRRRIIRYENDDDEEESTHVETSPLNLSPAIPCIISAPEIAAELQNEISVPVTQSPCSITPRLASVDLPRCKAQVDEETSQFEAVATAANDRSLSAIPLKHASIICGHYPQAIF